VAGPVRTVAYGRHPDQVADLTVPDGASPAAGWPTVVLIHGGFWREPYRRDLMTPLADDLAARGVAAWNVEYRRVGGAGGWPTTLTDTAAAVDHLAVVARDGPLDLARVAVAGHSAGGQLALWCASRARLPAGAPGADPAVGFRLVVGQAPVADLLAGEHLGDGAVGDLLGGGPAEVPERYAVADPAQLVGHGVPVLLVHGDGDDTVPTDQSQRYADAATVAGDDVELVVLPGDHFTVIDPASELWATAVEAIAAAW
jgi:acetyl esterase/lipase